MRLLLVVASPLTTTGFTTAWTTRRRAAMGDVVVVGALPKDLSSPEVDVTTTTAASDPPRDVTSSPHDDGVEEEEDSHSTEEMTDLIKQVNGQESSTTTSAADNEQKQQQRKESSVENIARDLEDRPLTAEYFATAMGIPSSSVESYECPETDAFCGFMSNACRVRLLPETTTEDHHRSRTAFYKRIVFADLPHAREKSRTAPHKLLRDARSYQVVASFLQSEARRQMVEATGVIVPRLYHVRSRPDYERPMESKFSFLFEDLAPSDGWYQRWLLDDADECHATLRTFARMHAFFWTGSSFWNDEDNTAAGDELEAAVWSSGSYVQPQAQDDRQCHVVAREWAVKRMRFRHESELSTTTFWDDLGERLESVAEECGRLAHPFADKEEETLAKRYRPYRTLTHGDPKQANLLFRRRHSPDPEDADDLDVGLLDFQWSGFGLAATDIAHLMTSGIHADQLVDGGEGRLLRYYYDQLETHLVEYGAFESVESVRRHFSFATFMEQYEIGVLDICRLMIAYTWDRFEHAVEKDDPEGCARTMNKTSYNKSVPTIVWLLSRCDEILRSRGV